MTFPRLFKFLLGALVWSATVLLWAAVSEPPPGPTMFSYSSDEVQITVTQLPPPNESQRAVEVKPMPEQHPWASYTRWLALIVILALLTGILLWL